MRRSRTDSAPPLPFRSLLARFYGILKEKAAQEDELARLKGDAPSRSAGPAPTKPDIAVRSAGPAKPDMGVRRVDAATRKVQ